jgi:hypothetical protein
MALCRRELPASEIQRGLGPESECRHGCYSDASDCTASVKPHKVSDG